MIEGSNLLQSSFGPKGDAISRRVGFSKRVKVRIIVVENIVRAYCCFWQLPGHCWETSAESERSQHFLRHLLRSVLGQVKVFDKIVANGFEGDVVDASLYNFEGESLGCSLG